MNNASVSVSISALVASPADTAAATAGRGVVAAGLGMKLTREVVGDGPFAAGLRVGREDQALGMAGVAAVGTTAAPLEGRRGAGRAGKSSLTLGGLVDKVMVANDSKSCRGWCGLAVVGVGF